MPWHSSFAARAHCGWVPDLLGQIPEDEQIGTVTAPSRDIASRCPAGQWTAPTIHAAATPPSSRAAPLRSSRSERTGGRTKKTASQTAKIHIRIALMNRFNALGTAEIIRTA
jgi:hypothetical protein